MPELIIPRTKLYECVATFRDELDEYGVSIEVEPKRVATIGKRVIYQCLDELEYVFCKDVIIESDSAIQIAQGQITPYPNTTFGGHFSEIKISLVEKPITLEGFEGATDENIDILFHFTPQIVAADPPELGWSERILVPMSDMESLALLS